MQVVKKIQSAPRPAARVLKNLKFYKAAWAALEVLPLELAERLTNYHEHGGLSQCRQGGDHSVRLSDGFPAGRRLAVEGEEHCYDCKQGSYADYHGQQLELPEQQEAYWAMFGLMEIKTFARVDSMNCSGRALFVIAFGRYSRNSSLLERSCVSYGQWLLMFVHGTHNRSFHGD
jgi:hypothetical protein